MFELKFKGLDKEKLEAINYRLNSSLVGMPAFIESDVCVTPVEEWDDSGYWCFAMGVGTPETTVGKDYEIDILVDSDGSMIASEDYFPWKNR